LYNNCPFNCQINGHSITILLAVVDPVFLVKGLGVVRMPYILSTKGEGRRRLARTLPLIHHCKTPSVVTAITFELTVTVPIILSIKCSSSKMTFCSGM